MVEPSWIMQATIIVKIRKRDTSKVGKTHCPSDGFLLRQPKTLGPLMIPFQNPSLTLPGKTQEEESIKSPSISAIITLQKKNLLEERRSFPTVIRHLNDTLLCTWWSTVLLSVKFEWVPCQQTKRFYKPIVIRERPMQLWPKPTS